MSSILPNTTTKYQTLKTVLLFLLLICFSYISTIENSLAAPLRVHFIDIGQGDSALIQSPNNKVVLTLMPCQNDMAWRNARSD